MSFNNLIKKVKKDDLINISTKYFSNKNYLVESNQYSRKVLKVIPLDINASNDDIVISLSLPWEMIESVSFIKKEYILYFLDHNSKKLTDRIKSILE
jgi:hypothetical protein